MKGLRGSTAAPASGMYPSLQGLASATNVVLLAGVASAQQDSGVTAGEGVLHLWTSSATGGVQQVCQYSVSGSVAGVTLPAATAWPPFAPLVVASLGTAPARYAALYVNPERRFFQLVSSVNVGIFWAVSRS